MLPEQPGRRRFIRTLLSAACTASVPALALNPARAGAAQAGAAEAGAAEAGAAEAAVRIRKKIPRSQQSLSAIGMGTWRTFNIGTVDRLFAQRLAVMQRFFALGGECIDSSPMYGSAQAVVGRCLQRLGQAQTAGLFAADKIWTAADDTKAQYQESLRRWGLSGFDLMQVHNLLNIHEHLPRLAAMKARGELSYVGITTSHGRRHAEMADFMRATPLNGQPLDFVQLTYNVQRREAEAQLLPLAQERGIGVIVNRPFGGGELLRNLQRRNAPLPGWAGEIDCENWPQFLLKFVISHPAVTCAIPATSRPEHMEENMGAARGPLPDLDMRVEMVEYLKPFI